MKKCIVWILMAGGLLPLNLGCADNLDPSQHGGPPPGMDSQKESKKYMEQIMQNTIDKGGWVPGKSGGPPQWVSTEMTAKKPPTTAKK